MKRVWLGGSGILFSALIAQGCFSLDWEFQTNDPSAGEANSSGNTGGFGTSSGSSGPPLTENCINRVDDDGDGKIDCGDTDCALYECAPAVPEGWTQYWMLQTAFDDASEVTCPEGQMATVLFTGPADSITCSTCTCTYENASCSSVKYINGAPGGFGCPVGIPKSADVGGCHAVTWSTGPKWCIMVPSLVANAGTCVGGPSSVIGPSKFEKKVQLCATPAGGGAGCLAGDACIQKKPNVFEQARLCIVQPGDSACPIGWNMSGLIAYEGATDARSCSNCGCDTNGVTCANSVMTVYGDSNDCSGNGVAILLNQCTDVEISTTNPSFNFVLATPSPGPCTQAVPSGSIETFGSHTICCRE
jgi:hypothetical protein